MSIISVILEDLFEKAKLQRERHVDRDLFCGSLPKQTRWSWLGRGETRVSHKGAGTQALEISSSALANTPAGSRIESGATGAEATMRTVGIAGGRLLHYITVFALFLLVFTTFFFF